MKIIAIIANDREPQGWTETFAARHYNDQLPQARAKLDAMIEAFNQSLRPNDHPRRLLDLTIVEYTSEEAYKMGDTAHWMGQDPSDNYWPSDHALFADWLAGWESAEFLSSRGSIHDDDDE